MATNQSRRPRSAWGIMALLALPFLVGAELSAAHQLADAQDPPATQTTDGAVVAASHCPGSGPSGS